VHTRHTRSEKEEDPGEKTCQQTTREKTMSGTLKCYFTVSWTVSPKSGKKPFGMYAAIEKYPGANFPSKQSRPNRKRPFL
jgi:hypothetical protein